jgi:hypothetical protein
MIKVVIPDMLLIEWFTKSLLPPIARDVAMGGVITEEQDITRDQYLDLVYSQSGTLYDLLLNVSRANTDPSKPSSSSHVDGAIDFIKTQSFSKSTTPSSTSPQTQISEVNVVQSTPLQQSGGKKKTTNKSKNNNEQHKNKTPATENKPQRKLKFMCIIYGDDHYTRDCPLHNEVAKIFQGKSQPTVITQPFPPQQSMVAQSPSPGGSSSDPHDDASSSAHLYMFNGINLTTLSKTYDTMGNPDKGKDTNGTGTLPDPSSSFVSLPLVNPPSGPLQIEKPTFDSILRPPKSTICKATFNPSSCAAQNYNIVEDLAQAPCAMSVLEVLQHCPSQRRMLLATLGIVDLESSNQIMFNLYNYTSRLSHQLAFELDVVVHNQQIHLWMREPQLVSCLWRVGKV